VDSPNRGSQNDQRSMSSLVYCDGVALPIINCLSGKHCPNHVFSEELTLMKKIQRHQNVISLIGICLQDGLSLSLLSPQH
jgi:hypothetical protein